MQAMMLTESTELDLASLSDDEAARMVDEWKAEADRHYWINANRSLELAEQIVRLGRERGVARYTALGLMTRGDAMKFLGRTADAWAALGEAGDLFQECGDEVGWARTRIGRLLICVDLGCVQEALADAETARAIFVRHGVREKQVVLDLNTAIVHDLLGEQRRALTLYHDAIALAEGVGEAGKPFLGLLYNCTGVGYHVLGALGDALLWYDRAYQVFLERQERSAAATTAGNIAAIAIARGDYRRALRMLHDAHRLNLEENLPLDATHAKRAMVECYLQLNRHAEARALAQEVISDYHAFGVAHREAITLLHLAAAEAQLGDLTAAQQALDTAEQRFTSLEAHVLVARARLGRGQIALRKHDFRAAEQIATTAGVIFAAAEHQVDFAWAQVMYGRSLLARGEVEGAAHAARKALQIARQTNMPSLRYTTHALLGRTSEAMNRLSRAERHYRAAAATVARVQHGLTLTLRPGFLEDKGEALRALIALYLRDGRAERAFETLEQAKSQALLSYLTDQRQLRWSADDAHSQALITQLGQLRDEHQWFYRYVHGHTVVADDPHAVEPERARAEVLARERRMRAITEELYLRSPESAAARAGATPGLSQIRTHIAHDDVVVEFYADGDTLWAFVLDRGRLAVKSLPATTSVIANTVQQLQLNIASALYNSANAALVGALTRTAQRLLGRLYAGLLEPLADLLAGRRRLVIVPYGILHYLPFHLLFTNGAYLVERYEVVILPASSLLTHRGPERPRGALVLAHSWDNRLAQAINEARVVGQLLGGTVVQEHAARRDVLRQAPRQILHIAAHGEHRLDQPEFSYLQLDDGQLYTDDLLQHDLSYELVTLSGCETGRANVAPGDELIGVGRGFLYAGAGAIVASLWQVPDDTAAALMERFYRRLLAGASKAEALRHAQCTTLQDEPERHPALWGAFQLVGDPRALTDGTSL
jgi:CHAT domain-containing protein